MINEGRVSSSRSARLGAEEKENETDETGVAEPSTSKNEAGDKSADPNNELSSMIVLKD